MQGMRTLMVTALLTTTILGCRTGKNADVFRTIDSDKSGYLNLPEVEAYGFKRMFARFDKDGDGAVTAQDLGETSPNLMRARDLDRNGRITLEEYTAAGRRQNTVKNLFRAADSDGDGRISPAETREYLGVAELGLNAD